MGSQEIPGVTGKFGLGVQNEAGQRLTVLPSERSSNSKHPLPTIQENCEHPTLSNIDHVGKIQAMKQLRSLSQMLM